MLARGYRCRRCGSGCSCCRSSRASSYWVVMYGGLRARSTAPTGTTRSTRTDGSGTSGRPRSRSSRRRCARCRSTSFVGVVRGIELACLVALAPFGAFVAILLPPVAAEVNSAQHQPRSSRCAWSLGMRWPALWTLPLLTKPSMGLGLLWFLVRREWRSFAIAVIPAAVIAAVSFVAEPADLVRLDPDARDLLGHAGLAVPDPALAADPDRRRAGDLGRPDEPAVDGDGRDVHRVAAAVLPVAGDPRRADPADGPVEVDPHLAAARRSTRSPPGSAAPGADRAVAPKTPASTSL